jgi:hypothetical protein
MKVLTKFLVPASNSASSVSTFRPTLAHRPAASFPMNTLRRFQTKISDSREAPMAQCLTKISVVGASLAHILKFQSCQSFLLRFTEISSMADGTNGKVVK